MATFEQQFTAFSKFGDSKSDGKTITLSQSDKWMKQANVFDKNITTTDTAICFKKMKVQKMTIGEYNNFIQDLASSKKVNPAELLGKMAACGVPGNPAAVMKTTEAVDRLTDTSKYTGTHKERFDESGKGKGLAGREDIVDDAGYVTGYKNKDTYGKK